MGALPGGLKIGEVVHHPPHLPLVESRADHDAGAACATRQHLTHPVQAHDQVKARGSLISYDAAAMQGKPASALEHLLFGIGRLA